MEPPTKRPRFRPAPFEDEDPDEDELVSRPEDVNARRDPGLRFERSRAFAAYKLKSAFESIFEKYGKDFTGVGDEIELSTGKVVVNNGHLQSLKDATELERDNEEEEEEDDATAAPTPPNEPLDLQEKANKEFDQGEILIKLQMPPMPQPLPPVPLVFEPSYYGGGWPGMAPTMGYPPMIPNTMFLPQMPYGAPVHGAPLPMPTMDPTWQTPELSLQMPYGAPTSMSMVDSTWQAPELPESAFGPMEPPVTPKRKKARQSTVTAIAEDGTDMDDILANDTPSADPAQVQEKPEDSWVRKTVLLPRPAPEADPGKRKRAPKSKSGKTDASQPKRRAGRHLSKKDASTPVGQDQNLRKPNAEVQTDGQEPSLAELTPSGINNRMPIHDTSSHSQEKDSNVVKSKRQGKSLPVRPRPGRETPIKNIGSDTYIDLSYPDTKTSKKPQNQSLRVEIVSKGSIDAASFRAITPEPVTTVSDPQEAPLTEECSAVPTESTVENETTSSSDIYKAAISDKRQGILSSPPVEVFAKNFIDTEYGFSDEDEPLPKRRQPKNDPGPVNEEMVNTPQPNVESAKKTADSATTGRQEPLKGAGIPASMGEIGRGPTNSPPSRQNQAELDEAPNNVELSSPKTMLPSSDTRKRRRPRRISMRGGASIGRVLEIPDSDPDGYISPQEDLYEAIAMRPSSPALPVEEFVEFRRPASPTLSSKEDDELVTDVANADLDHSPTVVTAQESTKTHHRAPSPILSSHSAEQDSTLALKAAAIEITSSPSKRPRTARRKKSSPSTPLKTPHQPIRRAQPRPSTSKSKTPTAAMTASAKRKNNILSLLSDSEDELSMMTPIPHNMTPTIRSSPASHHVRLFSSFPIPVSVSKPSALKRDALLNSASKAAASKTPGTRKSKRREKGISGSASGKRSSGMGIIPGTPSKSFVDDLTVQTPSGTVRRCGEDGFRCERDFCFGCL
ncbi:hypothetical protein QBC44DRAFT_325501 [Cladorrhinum sp. PSN332]|nr:hypothetical protein QBC44DRAFT_325501 [Cladorrhinum sp. PSN332]